MPVIIVRPGILDRLKEVRGIATDEAMARIGDVTVNTYKRYRDGEASPSAAFIANTCTTFGLSIGELVILTEALQPETATVPAA